MQKCRQHFVKAKATHERWKGVRRFFFFPSRRQWNLLLLARSLGISTKDTLFFRFEEIFFILLLKFKCLHNRASVSVCVTIVCLQKKVMMCTIRGGVFQLLARCISFRIWSCLCVCFFFEYRMRETHHQRF